MSVEGKLVASETVSCDHDIYFSCIPTNFVAEKISVCFFNQDMVSLGTGMVDFSTIWALMNSTEKDALWKFFRYCLMYGFNQNFGTEKTYEDFPQSIFTS